MQLRWRHIARNVICNWLALGANMLVGFFVSPFVVHRLGNVAYGVWVLAVSAVTYLTLLDLGLRSSVLRYVSKSYAQNDHAASSDYLSAALWVRLQFSVLVLLFSGVLALLFPHIFRVPPEMVFSARISILIIGLAMSVGMSVGVFGAVVSALNRYDLHSYIALTQSTFRVVAIITLLRMGKGIVAMALCELGAAILGNTLLFIISRRLYPKLRVRIAKPQSATLRQLWSYSIYAFLVTMSVRIVYETDNLVVGAFLSAALVTFYAIGNSLCRYSDQLVAAMTVTFVPAASTFEASSQNDRLRELFRHGTRITLAIMLPIVLTLVIRGRTFIRLWMGPDYAVISGTVLMILAIPLLFSTANNSASAIAFGTERHKTVAYFAIGEAVSNLTLSIVLVNWIGIYGVAIGTLVPSLVVNLLLWPRYIERLLGVSNRELFFNVWGRMFVAAVPFAICSFAIDRWVPAHSLMGFALQVTLVIPVFLLSIALLNRDMALQLWTRGRSFLDSKSQQAAAGGM